MYWRKGLTPLAAVGLCLLPLTGCVIRPDPPPPAAATITSAPANRPTASPPTTTTTTTTTTTRTSTRDHESTTPRDALGDGSTVTTPDETWSEPVNQPGIEVWQWALGRNLWTDPNLAPYLVFLHDDDTDVSVQSEGF